MPKEELAVFAGENVVGDGAQGDPVAKAQTELEHQRRLAAAHRPAHPDGKGTAGEVAVERTVAILKMPGMIQVLVGMRMAVGMAVRMDRSGASSVGVSMGIGRGSEVGVRTRGVV
jgi:hypothetical protein